MKKEILIFLILISVGFMGCVQIPDESDYTKRNYRYRLTINLTGAKIENHTLQPVTLNISSLNGSNIPALRVAFNNSGTWEEVPWEWFHQRGDTVKVNDTIRFRVNVFNNSLQRNYWIFTTDNGSIPPRNVSLFLFYDGFEIGNVDGWVNETRVIFDATTGTAIGNYAGNVSYISHNSREVFYDFPFELDARDIHICWFARWDKDLNSSVPYMLQNISNSYGGGKDAKLETWFYHQTTPHSVKLYDNDNEQVLGSYSLGTWYAWCYKNIDTTGADVNSDFYIDGILNYSNCSGYGTITKMDSISLSYQNGYQNGQTEKIFIDEIYVSVGYDYNIYETVPEIKMGTRKSRVWQYNFLFLLRNDRIKICLKLPSKGRGVEVCIG